MSTIAVFNGTSRTGRALIDQALDQGHTVIAVVRSAARFKSRANNQKGLRIEEFADFNDVSTLARYIRAANILVLIAGPPVDEPTHLLQDVVQTSVAAIRANHADPLAVRTRIVLQSSANISPLMNYDGTNPDAAPAPPLARFARKHILRYTYSDLHRAQQYLQKQSSWLDYMLIAPGRIVETVESSDKTSEWRLTTTEPPGTSPISYQRLASATLAACARSEEFKHKFVVPIATSPVPASFGDFKTAKFHIGNWLKGAVFYPSVYAIGLFAIGVTAGLWWQA